MRPLTAEHVVAVAKAVLDTADFCFLITQGEVGGTNARPGHPAGDRGVPGPDAAGLCGLGWGGHRGGARAAVVAVLAGSLAGVLAGRTNGS